MDSLIWKVHILIEMTQSHAFDRPLDDIGRDRMARSGLVTSIARSLVEKRDGRWVALQNVVGVTGEWGTGKSTLLNFVASYLDAFDGIVVVRFEPWLVSSEADVIDAFLREISRKVGASPGERVRGLAAEIDKYREAVAGAAEYAFPGAGTLAKFIPRMRTRTLTDRKIRLARRLLDFQGAIVVVVDELDRVDNTDVKEVAKFINSVGSLPGISFLVGYDYKRVSKILSASDDTQSGEEYLRKIVQVNIPLRGMFDYEMNRQLEEGIGERRLSMLKRDLERWGEALSACDALLKNPRDIKRTVLAYHVIADAVEGEIDPIDAFCYAAVSAGSLTVLNGIHENVDRLVVDPVRYDMDFITELLNDRDTDKDVLEKLGLDKEQFDHFRPVLTLLFPKSGQRAAIECHGRILERKNLLALIFLGNPPFRVSRKSIEEFWAKPAVAKLNELEKSKNLEDFVSQLRKLISDLPEELDREAFRIVLEFVKSSSVDKLGVHRKFVGEIESMLLTYAQSSTRALARVRAIVGDSIAEADFALSSAIVRHHMFAFGLVKGQDARDYDVLYGADEFNEVLAQELARYRATIEGSEWPSDFRDADPFYALLQGGCWDDGLRSKLAEQLKEPAHLSYFCALFAPPGHSFGKGTMGCFVDEAQLTALLDESDEEDPYLLGCRQRVRALMAGKHWSEVD